MLFSPFTKYVRQTAVEQFVHAFGVDVSLVVDAQHVLWKILCRLAPYLLAARLAVEPRVVAGAVHGPVTSVVAKRKTLVRAGGGEPDNVAVGADVVIRDDTGAVIGPPGASISLAGNGHTSFVLSDPSLGFPVTADKRGTIDFDTPAGSEISVLGLLHAAPERYDDDSGVGQCGDGWW